MSRRAKAKAAARRVREAALSKPATLDAEVSAAEPVMEAPAAQAPDANEPVPSPAESPSAKAQKVPKKTGRIAPGRILSGFRKDIIRLGSVMLVVTVISGGLLGWVNSVTADKIVAINAQRIADALEQLIPEAQFAEIEVPASADPVIRAVWAADKNGEPAGVYAQVCPTGYVGELTIIVGIDAEGKIAGVKITKHSETAGLGAMVAKPAWLAQFAGLSGPLNLIKNGSAGENDIVAVTSATATSAAVTGGVQAALSFAKAYMGVE